MTRRLAWAIGLLAGAILGCQRHAATDVAGRGPPPARETHHRELRAEWARLVADRATPELLQAAAEESDPGGLSARRTHEALHQILPPSELAVVLERLQTIYPRDAFQWQPAGFLSAQALRSEYESVWVEYRALLATDAFRFPVSLAVGFLADLSFLDHATAAHRLEAISAADALLAERPREAVLPLRNMFRIDAQLAALPHVASRLTAVALRGEALRVVEAVAGHPQASRDLQQQLAEMIRAPLADWPPDATAWIGDRALGMQTYDMVRGGQLLSLLTPEETDVLRKGQDVKSWSRAVLKALDDDEWFYLATMRELIESCEEPFYRRAETLARLTTRVDQLRDTPRFPLIAAHVLLGNVAHAMRLQAVDRARCEAWSLALAAATGQPLPRVPDNPITGEPLVLVTSPERVAVPMIDGRADGESVTIPVLSDNARDIPHTSD